MIKKLSILLLLLAFIFTTPLNKAYAESISSTVTVGNNDSSLIGNTFNRTSTTNTLGKNGTTSVKTLYLFSGISVPKNATITNAYLDFGVANSGGNTINVNIAAQNTSTPTAPTNKATFTTVTSNLTTQSVNWNNVPKGTWGQVITSPNIAPVIQEVVNRSDWISGRNIQISVADNGSGNYSNTDIFTANFTGSGQKPKLTIVYSTGSNPTPTPTATPTPTPTSTPTPTPTPTTTPTPTPTMTPTPTPTVTITPTETPTPTPTETPTPTVTVTPNPTPTPNPGETIISFPVTYNSTSGLYYKNLTFIASVGSVSAASVYAGGNQIPSIYNSTTGELAFSTSQSPIEMRLTNVSNPSTITVTKAALKDNKKWAWSIGFDDNVNIRPSVEVLSSLGYRGTFYLIGNIVHPTRDEYWILDKPYLVQQLNQGWSIGNHTWDHDCGNPNTQTVVDGFNVGRDIVNSSQVPGYKVLGFAAPCFVAGYDSVIEGMRANNQTEVKFNESRDWGLAIVNEGSSEYTAGTTTAVALSSETVSFGRDGEIDWAPANVKSRMTWMANNASSTRNFWLNTYLHGSRESNLSNVANFAYNNYGTGGTNEMWMAPADEIYSYLMVRDNATIGALTIQ